MVKTHPLIVNQAAVTTAIINPVSLADCTLVDATKHIALTLNNGLDQTVRIEIIGNYNSNPSGAFILKSMMCDAGDKVSYGFSTQEWMPFLGVRATPTATPTSGAVNASLVWQE